MWLFIPFSSVFFFNDTATTEIYTLSLHDALPIYAVDGFVIATYHRAHIFRAACTPFDFKHTYPGINHLVHEDRKSTRLNSSHANISYAVFCLKKKNNT